MRSSVAPDSDPVIEAYKRDIDRTLIRRNLRLTPEERLIQMQRLAASLDEIRQGMRTAPADRRRAV